MDGLRELPAVPQAAGPPPLRRLRDIAGPERPPDLLQQPLQELRQGSAAPVVLGEMLDRTPEGRDEAPALDTSEISRMMTLFRGHPGVQPFAAPVGEATPKVDQPGHPLPRPQCVGVCEVNYKGLGL